MVIPNMKKENRIQNVLEWLENSEQSHQCKTAVDDGEVSLTFHELLIWSRRIGSGISQVTSPKKPVAVFMEKSSVTLAAMFGVVYAGCFYVMIDPEQPPERIKKIFQVLQPETVVTQLGKQEQLADSGYQGTVLFITQLLQERILGERLGEIRRLSKETDLLYGIFTSGSTGTPKGIVVSHQAVIRFISHFTDLFAISEQDQIGNQAPFDFDVSVKDIYSSIKTGASLIIIPRKLFTSPARLLDYLCEKEVTTLIWAVSALCLVSSLKGLNYRVPDTVNKILFSGEAMPAKHLRSWQRALPGAVFVNLYGPSEITCNCTYYRVEHLADEEEKIPIGKAFPGREVFLMDETQKEIPMPGKVGEICVAGESLAEGYYGDPKQSREKFLLYPVAGKKIQRIYRTGDLGYYGKNGMLYFAGRRDFQIKHMGRRIELEEIENAMMGLESISSVCCIFDPDRQQIVAFYTGEEETGSIRQLLKAKIPAYMIPGKLIRLHRMPLNKNGKKDRGLLKRQIQGGILCGQSG